MDADILIIGAGVVGLAIAMKLSDHFTCIVVEKNSSFGNETSSRNSEVIHSGIYYPKNTLKTSLCIEGNPLIYQHCKKYGVPFNKCGKFIIANESQSNDLWKIFDNAKRNNVVGLRKTNIDELRDSLPNVSASCALYASETGIVDSHSLMNSFETIAQNNACTIAYNHKVTAISKIEGGYCSRIEMKNEQFTIGTKFIVNSAGLYADEVAAMIGIDIISNCLSLSYCKGNYFKIVNSNFKFKQLVYPVPDKSKAGLGIHVTIDLNGSAKLGPDAVYMQNKAKDYSVAHAMHEKFFNAAKMYIKGLESDDIAADYSGIRPKLQKEGESFADFYIANEIDKGLPGFINLIGVESPGLTSSIAIANYVDDLICF